jgi:aarF domain-containing kinase
VHRAALLDGTQVVVKIQYPGVATSIQSDLENLRLLVKTFNVFPEGLYIDSILNFAKGELTQEVDYRNEAKCVVVFNSLLPLEFSISFL